MKYTVTTQACNTIYMDWDVKKELPCSEHITSTVDFDTEAQAIIFAKKALNTTNEFYKATVKCGELVADKTVARFNRNK